MNSFAMCKLPQTIAKIKITDVKRMQMSFKKTFKIFIKTSLSLFNTYIVTKDYELVVNISLFFLKTSKYFQFCV